MRNWPNERSPFRERAKELLSNLTIGFACSLPQCQRGPLAGFQAHGNDGKIRKYDLSAIPSNLTVRPLEIVYSDLISLEDFSKLEQGLIKLIRSQGAWFSVREAKDIAGTFRDIRSRRNGGWYNIGWLDFEKSKRVRQGESRISLAQTAHLELSLITSCMLALTITVIPSELFQKKFASIISTNERQKTIIDKYCIRNGVRAARMISGQQQRERQINSLFLCIQKQIVQLLRNHIRAGMSQLGPLPSVEVFVTNRHIDNAIPMIQSVSNMTPEECGFWRTLNINLDSSVTHYKDWLTIYQTTSRQKEPDVVWRALVDKEQFLASESLDGYGNDESHAMTSVLADSMGIGCLALMAAVMEQYEKFVSQISQIRDQLSPILAGNYRKFRIGRLSQIFRLETKIRTLRFIIDRLQNEIRMQDMSLHFQSNGFNSLQRKKVYDDEEQVSLVDDLYYRMNKIREFATSQLGLLADHCKDLINAQMIRSNASTQSKVFRLTLVIAVLTIVLVILTWEMIPIDRRSKLLDYAQYLIHKFRLLLKK